MNAAQPGDDSASPGDAGTTDPAGTGASGGQVPPPGTAREAANDNVLDSARGLLRDFGALAGDHLQLALLETQRAGKSAINMLVYAIAAALLLVTAWLGLLAALAIGLAMLGLNAALAVLVVVALNVAGAGALYVLIRRSAEYLKFPATMRTLRNDAAAIRGAGRSGSGSGSAE